MNILKKLSAKSLPLALIIILAGLVGGLAEILWVMSYSMFSATSGVEVARQVTASVFPAAASLPHAPLLGVGIHLVLSLLLAAGFVFAVWVPLLCHHNPATIWLSTIAALTGVWLINFLVVLPVINPTFVELMPYAVTLVSKIMFGLAMGWVLCLFHNSSSRLFICTSR